MVFEGVDSTLSGVPVVYMWQDQLKGAIVSHNSLAESCTNLVVHSMHGGELLCLVKPGVDVLICSNMVGILFGGKRLY